jgi:hypothetical protein
VFSVVIGFGLIGFVIFSIAVPNGVSIALLVLVLVLPLLLLLLLVIASSLVIAVTTFCIVIALIYVDVVSAMCIYARII